MRPFKKLGLTVIGLTLTNKGEAMNLIFKLFIIFGATSAIAQSIQTKGIKEDHFDFSRAEIIQGSKGEMLFKSEGKSGATMFLSVDDGFRKLKDFAKKACAYGPSSITGSIGVISVTWEKSQICEEEKK